MGSSPTNFVNVCFFQLCSVLFAQGTDIKIYVVGPDYAHAEARKSPVVDGIVQASIGHSLSLPFASRPLRVHSPSYCTFSAARQGRQRNSFPYYFDEQRKGYCSTWCVHVARPLTYINNHTCIHIHARLNAITHAHMHANHLSNPPTSVVCLAFRQNVCGFDLLRTPGRSYVCDVNG
jgi:hypothetical protein